jgi:hypothetical protein
MAFCPFVLGTIWLAEAADSTRFQLDMWFCRDVRTERLYNAPPQLKSESALASVVCLRQFELASVRPTFDFCFAPHGIPTGGKALVVDQAERPACASVAGAASFCVHFEPPSDIVRPTGIDRSVGAKEKIDKGGTFPRSHRGLKIRPSRSLAFQV